MAEVNEVTAGAEIQTSTSHTTGENSENRWTK